MALLRRSASTASTSRVASLSHRRFRRLRCGSARPCAVVLRRPPRAGFAQASVGLARRSRRGAGSARGGGASLSRAVMILLTLAYAGRAPCLRRACPGATALPASERYGPLAPRDCLARRAFSFPVTADRGAHSNPTAAPLRPCMPPHRAAPAAISVSPVFTPTPGIGPVPPIPSCGRAPPLRDRWTGGARAITGRMGALRAPTAAARGEGTLPPPASRRRRAARLSGAA